MKKQSIFFPFPFPYISFSFFKKEELFYFFFFKIKSWFLLCFRTFVIGLGYLFFIPSFLYNYDQSNLILNKEREREREKEKEDERDNVNKGTVPNLVMKAKHQQ